MRRRWRRTAPHAIEEQIILGEAVGGDLDSWTMGSTAVFPAAMLGRHVVVVGATGVGKTETLLRIAHGAASQLGWHVLFLDAKGDYDTVPRFVAAMRAAGKRMVRVFPDESYDGWRGDALAILNRLMAVENFSEPYYRSTTKKLLQEALGSPLGVPRSAGELLERLASSKTREGIGAEARYSAFFGALGGKLDGEWAFEDADAAYILLEGLALKEEAASLGRFLMEDFAHYVAKRKKRDQRVLLIIDEFSALAAGADAANLFERVRSLGAAVAVSSQSYAGLGEGADRILDAAGSVICHQNADPERLAARAGTRRVMEHTIQFDMTDGPTGLGSLRSQDAFRVHPDAVRQLGVGECFAIANGRALRIRVTPLRLDGHQGG